MSLFFILHGWRPSGQTSHYHLHWFAYIDPSGAQGSVLGCWCMILLMCYWIWFILCCELSLVPVVIRNIGLWLSLLVASLSGLDTRGTQALWDECGRGRSSAVAWEGLSRGGLILLTGSAQRGRPGAHSPCGQSPSWQKSRGKRVSLGTEPCCPGGEEMWRKWDYSSYPLQWLFLLLLFFFSFPTTLCYNFSTGLPDSTKILSSASGYQTQYYVCVSGSFKSENLLLCHLADITKNIPLWKTQMLRCIYVMDIIATAIQSHAINWTVIFLSSHF